MESFSEIREAGFVKRYHTSQTIRTQTVAEHSWHVAQILVFICPTDVSKRLLLAALDHDVPEIVTGDLPAPFKWDHPELNTQLKMIENKVCDRLGLEVCLDEQEVHLLKWADMLELVLWCREELDMGNSHVRDIYNRGVRYLQKLKPVPSMEAQQLLDRCGLR